MRFVKNIYLLIQDLFLWLFNLNLFFYKNLYKSLLSLLSYISFFIFVIPYKVAYYFYLLLFKLVCIIAKYFYGVFSILKYFLMYIIFFIITYIFILEIFKNYIIIVDNNLFFTSVINSVWYFNNSSFNLNNLSGIYFDALISKFYLNPYFNLDLNKEIFKEFIINKYLVYSFTIYEYYTLRYNYSLGWVSDYNIDLYFLIFPVFEYISLLKYYIIWLIDTFWFFDTIFLNLKYLVWYTSLNILNYLFFQEFISLYLNSFFIYFNDFFLLEFGYNLKINIIVLIETIFDHVYGYFLKFIKFLNLSSGVSTSHKKLLLCFNDYNIHKDSQYYSNVKIRSLGTLNFYKGKSLLEAYKVLNKRSNIIIDGTPFFEKHTNFSARSLKKPAQSFWFSSSVNFEHFSKLNFLEPSVLKYNFAGSDFVFQVRRELAHTGFYSMYKFSTLELTKYKLSNLASNRFMVLPELNVSFKNFGHKEKVYIYSVNFFFILFIHSLLFSFNLVVSLFDFFFIIISKIYYLFFLIFIFFFYRTMVLFYNIEYYNKLKIRYNSLNRINFLYEPRFLIDRNTSLYTIIWLFNKNLVPKLKIKFVIVGVFKYLKFSFLELFYFSIRFVKYVYYFFYKNLYLKFFLFIINIFKFIIFKLNILKIYFINILKNIVNIFFYIINNFLFLFIFSFFKIIKIIIPIFILFFVYNLIYIFFLIYEIIYNISIIELYPTYTVLSLLFVIILTLSCFNFLNKYILGFSERNFSFFIALDDYLLYDHWDVFVGLTETPGNVMINNQDFGFVTNEDSLVKDAGVFITDKGRSSYDFLLLKRFDIFYSINNNNTNLKTIALFFKYPLQLFYFFFLPGVQHKSFYNFFFTNFFNTFFLHKFRDLSPSTYTSLDLFYNFKQDKIFGLKSQPVKVRSRFSISENVEPRLELFKNDRWFNDFFISNSYKISTYTNNFIIFNKINNLKLLNISFNSINIISNLKNIKFFKKIGDFNQFRYVYHPRDLNFDYEILLNLNYSKFFQKNYIGFQLNSGLLNLKNKDILLYNPYECYDNIYKRRFYTNLYYYRNILNLKLFPYVTIYEHKRLLSYLNCSENAWNKIETNLKNINLNYPFYEFPIFIFLAFHFYINKNSKFPYGSLKNRTSKAYSYGQRHNFIFDEPVFESTLFFKGLINNFNLFFEKLLLVFTLPGNLLENSWRFFKFLFFILYTSFYIFFDEVNFFYLDTIFYLNFVDYILIIWFFIERIFFGFILYDLFYILF